MKYKQLLTLQVERKPAVLCRLCYVLVVVDDVVFGIYVGYALSQEEEARASIQLKPPFNDPSIQFIQTMFTVHIVPTCKLNVTTIFGP